MAQRQDLNGDQMVVNVHPYHKRISWYLTIRGWELDPIGGHRHLSNSWPPGTLLYIETQPHNSPFVTWVYIGDRTPKSRIGAMQEQSMLQILVRHFGVAKFVRDGHAELCRHLRSAIVPGGATWTS